MTDACGRCGSKITDKNRRGDGYNSLCSDCRVPHQLLQRVGEPPVDRWRCTYCGAEGAMVQLQCSDCSHRYAPCGSCGLAPYCAPDCQGVAEVLSGAGVYLAGFKPE